MRSLGEDCGDLAGIHWVNDAGGCSGVYVMEDGRTLIDAGNMYGLTDELRDFGPLERLERVLLTHAHFDHVGGLAEIFSETSPDIFLHEAAREPLSRLKEPFPSFFEILEKDKKIHFLRDGDVIPCNPSLRALYTPGHTAGDLCFFAEALGGLFSGDAIPYNSRARDSMGLARPDVFSRGCVEDWIQSLRKLLRLNIRHLLPGHGEPVFHTGADRIKLGLFSLYSSVCGEQKDQAWIMMGYEMLDAGFLEEARQCAAKAMRLTSDSVELRLLLERMEGEAAK